MAQFDRVSGRNDSVSVCCVCRYRMHDTVPCVACPAWERLGEGQAQFDGGEGVDACVVCLDGWSVCVCERERERACIAH